jgi:hypothetical protein
MNMARRDTTTEAVFDTTRSLSYEAIHLGMMPVVHERLLARLIQFEPLLGMATLGLTLNVPVVPMHSLLQFFDGRRVECHDDWVLISDFYKSCVAKVRLCPSHACKKATEMTFPIQDMFMTKISVLEGNPGGQTSELSAYITCPSEKWDSPNGPLRERINLNAQGDKKMAPEILQALSKKLYGINEKVLNASAHCKHSSSFLRCLQSLQRPYDMRAFVGGMSKFQVRSWFFSLNAPIGLGRFN